MVLANQHQHFLRPPTLDPREKRLIGLWFAGERWLQQEGAPVETCTWFHFREGGEVVLSMRTDDQRNPQRVFGRWWTESSKLVVVLATGAIRAPYSESQGVLHWAGETLVRTPR